MKIQGNVSTKKGAIALAYIQSKDNQVKTMRATTAGMAEGNLKFPAKKDDWAIVAQTWTGRDGNVRDYPCILCKDAEGEDHAVALSAFREKEPIETAQGVVNTPNLVEFDADYQSVWNALQSAKSVTLHRVVGKRNGRKGRYEYFTYE